MDGENLGFEGDLDLFGDPVRLPNGKRGRPAHVASQKNHNKVMMLCALGWSQERIANALHISVPTLTRYYSSTLKRRLIQRDRLDAWRIEKAIEQAASGNVGAMRLLDQLIAKNDQMIGAARFAGDQVDQASEDDAKPEPVGKKEQARRDAETGVAANPLFTPGAYTN